VRIVTYGCVEVAQHDVVLSREHKPCAWLPFQGLTALCMPEGYKRSVQCWAQRLRSSSPVGVACGEIAQKGGSDETRGVSRRSALWHRGSGAEPPNHGLEPTRGSARLMPSTHHYTFLDRINSPMRFHCIDEFMETLIALPDRLDARLAVPRAG
jgi:hypothetical protein